eukprot:CAMPEP_0115434976 /NCGR_PEP_ID=MMETSP0271-20121206/33423_1 /TAXON_ID=71861 /ORGANISM="Scrippsiella trochoidea, Strain CCMP3099" /LENGTH=105 /DNA_ID=CAMNT_0002860423 /DNA_START=172 /DNA_END=487 /DNA_ORIENTATION=-
MRHAFAHVRIIVARHPDQEIHGVRDRIQTTWVVCCRAHTVHDRRRFPYDVDGFVDVLVAAADLLLAMNPPSVASEHGSPPHARSASTTAAAARQPRMIFGCGGAA